MADLLISISFLGNLKCIEDESFVRRTRKKNSNHTLHYLQNILPYIIIECKMHYASLKFTKFKTLFFFGETGLENVRHFQITIIDSLI